MLPSDVQKVCTLGGISHKVSDGQTKISTLEELERSLTVSINEAEQAIKDEYFWRAMEVSTKFVAVSCDVGIGILETRTGPVGSAVAAVYDVSKLIVDAANGDLTLVKAVLYNGGIKVSAVQELLVQVGRKRSANAAGYVKTLVAASYDLTDFVSKRGGDLTSATGTSAARQTAIGQLRRIKARIDELKTILRDCADE